MNNVIFNFSNQKQNQKIMMNHKLTNNNLLRIKREILDEIKIQQNSFQKLFVVRNIYPQKNNKFILDIFIQGSKNQNDFLINHVKNTFYQYPTLLEFLNQNFSLNKPLSIEFYYTRDFKPIILVNKRGFHLIDFVALLEKSNRTITPQNLSFTSKNKIF